MKNKYFTCISLLLALSIGSVYGQSFTVSGQCLNKDKEPLEFITISVLTLDSLNTGVGKVTDDSGIFRLKVNKGNYYLQFSFVGMKTTLQKVEVNDDIDLGKIFMDDSFTELKEIVVTAKKTESFGNRDEIIISENERKAALDGLDVVATLPQFTKDQVSNTLKTIDNKNLLILIDGQNASSEELTAIQPERIRRVIYYTQPPSRYADYNVGGVVNILTKRTNEKHFSLFLNTRNSFTTGYGTNQLYMQYADSLNRITAAYFIDYRDLDDNRIYQTYDYDSQLLNEYTGLPSRYAGQYHISQLSYQYSVPEKTTFISKIEYKKNPGTEQYEQNFVSKHNGTPVSEGLSNKYLKSDYDAISLDLYYSKIMNKNKLDFNILNTYYSSQSTNELNRSALEGNDYYDYQYTNKFENKSYSLVAELFHSIRLSKGEINTGGRFSFKNLEQKNENNISSEVQYFTEYFYTEYSNEKNAFSFNIGIGVENTSYKGINNQKYNFMVPKPSLSLNYQINDQSSLRLNSSVKSVIPSIGMLTMNQILLDEKYYSTGNVDLKPYYYFDNKFQYTNNMINGKLQLIPSVFYNYAHKPNMPLLSLNEGWVVKQNMPIDKSDIYGFDFVLVWKPLKWVTIQPYYKYSYYSYKTPLNDIDYDQHMTSLSIALNFDKITGGLGGMLPLTTPDGDFYQKRGGYFYSFINWKYKNGTLGLRSLHNPNPETYYSETKIIRTNERTTWNNFRNLFVVNFTYSFSTGKIWKANQKRISNSDDDSGLTKDNTAK